MSRRAPDGPTAARTPSSRERRRVVLATVVGTTVEWYDFFIYASAAGLVFGQLFFEPAGPSLSTLLAFGSVGVSFLFRPLGAFIAGHLGDKYGRRVVLVLTLVLMGVATALIGLLPTYAQIGVAAPVLLVLLRILQGISAGGEWGGAVLMSCEHAPVKRRGLFGASPQIGVPLGLLLASGVLGHHDRGRPGRRLPRLGLARPVPAERRADRHRVLGAPQRRGEPGVRRDRAARGDDPPADAAAVPQAHAAGDRRRPRVRGQQRRRLHDHRRLHPALRVRPGGSRRARPGAGAVGRDDLRRRLARSRRGSRAPCPTVSAGAPPTSSASWCSSLGVLTLFPLVNAAERSARCCSAWASCPSAWGSPTARRRRSTPSCSRRRSGSPASPSPTRSGRSSAARSRPPSRRRSSRRPARRRR